MNLPAKPDRDDDGFSHVEGVVGLLHLLESPARSRAERLGAALLRWRLAIVLVWLLLALFSGWIARALPQRLVEGSGPLPGSASQRVEQALRDEFDHPFTEPLVLAVASERLTADDAPFRRWLDDAAARLGELAEVRQVIAPPSDAGSSLLRSPGGHRAVLLIELQATGLADRERVVPRIRAALAELEARIRREDDTARVALTGRAAATVDNSELNRNEGERAERLALPFTLLVLLLSFGSVGAAALPLAAGLVAMSVALGLAGLLAGVVPVSGLLVNVVKMLGLALGVDYALLMVSHWRARAPLLSLAAALGTVVIDAGGTIAWSGLAVLVGLGGLLFSPLLETRSIGLAGMLVVCTAVLAALTLLPALVALLGPRLDWPPALARVLARLRVPGWWAGLARVVTQRPLAVLAVAGSASLAIALPGLAARSGFDDGPSAFPNRIESRIGDAIVADMGRVQLTLPIHLIVRARDGGPVLGQRQSLEALLDRLSNDPRVALVTPPLLAIDAGLADAALSRDRHALLLQVFAHARADLAQVQGLARYIAWATPGTALRVDVGGPPVYYAEHVEQVEASFVPVFGFVIGASVLLLFLAFRSWLLPIKAVCANLLAVAAGYGAVVAVFQLGWGASWLGVASPLAMIPPVVPLLVFCLSFGLSMDYEVFLLRAIQRGWRRSRDNRAASAEGLIATAPVITGAAAVMAVVFASFIATDVALLKMLGLGLVVTVLVDATLVRCLIVPALVCIIGRWNWLPGSPARRPRAEVQA
jgi:RND superfamily putative drug exporter